MRFVLLRGLARETGHWLGFPDVLRQEMGADCEVFCVDFPGCGEHYEAPALNAVDAMTDHARQRLANQGIDLDQEAVYLIGVSMGGMVALDWLARFPNEVAGVVLINSSAGHQPFWWRLRPRAWFSFLLALTLPPTRREAWVLRKVSNCVEDYPQFLCQWQLIQQQRPVSRTTILTMLKAAARFQPRIIEGAKGLVLGSSADRLVSVKASQDLARRYGWPLVIHPHAGHDLPLDDAPWIALRIHQWLQHP